MNCTSLEDAEAVVLNLHVVLTSRTVSSLASSSYNWLKNAIKKLGCKEPRECLENVLNEYDDESDSLLPEEGNSSSYGSEETYYIQSPKSPFKIHFDSLILSQKGRVLNACEDANKENRYFMPSAMEHIQRCRLPTLPLWSGVLTSE